MSGSQRYASIVIGNTYNRMRASQAEYDRSGQHKKIHDWTLYVDVVDGDQDAIDHIDFQMNATFSPRLFQHYSPVRLGNGAYRFSTRQTTYATGMLCEIKIHGIGNTVMKINYTISPNAAQLDARPFIVSATAKASLGPAPISNDATFGIELELTSANHHPPHKVATQLARQSQRPVQVMIDNYAEARSNHDFWKLMRDSSIECHINRPNCNAFELVSPILKGTNGLRECQAIMKGLKNVRSIRVNKSMGFHVHVNVEGATLLQLIKICQNFIKYENAMDSMMPFSRRGNTFCQSNRGVVPGETNKEKHESLGRCQTLDDLMDAMNPGDSRYFKLNLVNLKTGRQPTVEFRQHSSTVSQEKVLNWIRFCVSLVSNSMRLKSPSSLKQSRSLDDQMEMLFQYAVKDRYLAIFYKKRRQELVDSNEACCQSCSSGNSCQKNHFLPRQVGVVTVRDAQGSANSSVSSARSMPSSSQKRGKRYRDYGY